MAKDPKDQEQEEIDEYHRRAFENQPRVGLLTPREPPKPVPPPEPPPKIEDPFGPVRIRVVEDATGKPISNVKISFWGNALPPIYTNAEGIAEAANAEGRTYIAECPLEDKPLSQTLDYVGEGETPIHPQSESSEPDSSTELASGSNSGPTGASSSSSSPQPELVIAQVKEYKVKTGDTLQSIGLKEEQYFLPEDVSFFNWGVMTNEETQEKLRDFIGCTKKDEDGDYVFDDSDSPGIIYLWKKWEMTGVHINEMRTLRVRKNLEQQGKSAKVRVKSPDGKPIANLHICFEMSDGTVQMVETDAQGNAVPNMPKDESVKVSFPTLDAETWNVKS
jgi:hypothetical protein